MKRMQDARRDEYALTLEEAGRANDVEPGVSVEDGDLILRAPSGRIVLEAGTVLELRAGATLKLESPEVDVTATRASLHVAEVTILADAIRTTADEIATRVGRLELHALRLVERAGDVVRHHTSLQLHADRVRTLVRETFHLFAKRTSIASEEDTSVDGKRVLLG